MFTFLKIIKPFLLPSAWVLLGMLVGVFLVFKNKRRAGIIVILITATFYYSLSIEPVSYLLAKSLEERYAVSALVSSPQDVEAIVILAAGADKPAGYRTFPELGGTSWRRLWRGIEVYRTFEGTVPIIYSGGSGDPFDPVSIEAQLAKEYAVSMGIPEQHFWVEHNSRTTRESGVAIRKMLDEKFSDHVQHHIVLVTSARHTLRALLVFKQNGIEATPFPADIAGGSLDLDVLSFFPSASDFSSSIASIHEWVGFGGYWIRADLYNHS